MLQGILAHNSPLKTLIQQDPSCIHPRLGLHNVTKNKQIYEFSEKVPRVKIFKPIQKKQNVVMVYIASRVLSEKEKKIRMPEGKRARLLQRSPRRLEPLVDRNG